MTEPGMTDTGAPSPPKADEDAAARARAKSLQDAGGTAKATIEQDSSVSEAIDRATAAIGKDEA